MRVEPFHIFVLEDKQPDLILLQKSLGDAGLNCQIMAFEDGEKALAYVGAAASRVPDLILLDFSVPKVDGASVLNGIRGNPRWAHVAVFMLSILQDPATIARAKMLGADRFLVKPADLIGFTRLGEFIKDWLYKKADGSLV